MQDLKFEKKNIMYLQYFLRNCFTLVLLLGYTIVTNGQTDNYWSWTFNTPSTLLAGAVVGGSAGPSAIYYNPALIDHGQIPSLSLSANLMSLQFLKADNIAGEGVNADKFLFKIQPRFISFIIKNKNNKLGMEVAVLSTASEETPFTIQHRDTLNLLQEVAGDEIYTGYINYRRRYDDTWVGYGASYNVTSRLYLGLSLFVSIKSLKYNFRTEAFASSDQDSVIVSGTTVPSFFAENTFSEELKYWNISLITKLGIQYSSANDRFGVGTNLTFPSIPVYGQSDMRRTFTRGNVFDPNSNQYTPNETNVSAQTKVQNIIKLPFSISIGFQYKSANKKNLISIAAEYFHGIDEYSLSLSDESDLPGFENLNFFYSSNPVTNVAIGFKQFISESLFFLGGFRTDFSAQPNSDFRLLDEKATVNRIKMDKYHFTAGTALSIKTFTVISGLQYSRGRNKNYGQAINFSDPIQFNQQTQQGLEGIRTNTASVKLDEIGLFFGFILDL